MKIAISLAALLAAYGQQSAPPAANKVSKLTPIAKQAAPAAKAFVYDEKNDLLEYHYAWSTEAAAVPQLVERLRAAMDKEKAELLAYARASLDDAINAYSLTNYVTAGQSPRLLSLSVDVREDAGGAAHGDYAGTRGLLWDRQAAKEIAVADLFAAPANMDRLLTQRWCDALKAHEEKRGEAARGTCPKLSDIAIIPTDKDKNGRFERLILTASSYAPGPCYGDSPYEIDLAVAPDLIAALKSDYRDSFEVGQPQ